MEQWISPLTELAILFACGALGGVGLMFGLDKPISVASVCEAIFKSGSLGAGVGLIAIEKVSKGIGMGLALLVGGGWLGKKEIGEGLASAVKRFFGVNNG